MRKNMQHSSFRVKVIFPGGGDRMQWYTGGNGSNRIRTVTWLGGWEGRAEEGVWGGTTKMKGL